MASDRLRGILACCLGLLLWQGLWLTRFSGWVWAGEPQLVVLPSGLRVVVQEDHTAPIVALNLWVRVGSADEGEEVAGVSHLLEHMLFKGSEGGGGSGGRGAGEMARAIEALGGRVNAYTTADHTVYHLVVASRFWDRGLRLLAEAVQRPTFDPAELEREKAVVLEEVKRGEDSPARKLARGLFAAGYERHPYGRPVIGRPETISRLGRADLVQHFKTWYVPGNMTLVVVGAIEPPSALAKIREAFQSFNPEVLPRPARPEEPPQQALRSVVLTDRVQTTHLGLLFHIPQAAHADVMPLQVLTSLLGQGRTSRLYQRVKERGLVHTIGASLSIGRDPGVLSVTATLDGGRAEAALEAILGELFALHHGPIDQAGLAGVKAGLLSRFIYDRETVQGQAGMLGRFDALYQDPAFEQTYRFGLARVVADDVQRVARRYLTPHNLTVGLLYPPGGPAGGSGSGPPAPDAPLDRKRIEAVVNRIQPSVPVRAGEADRVGRLDRAGGSVSQVPLGSNVTLLVRENRHTGTVALRAVWLGGLRFEQPDTNGINQLIARLLTRGTSRRNASQIAAEMAAMAGSLVAAAGKDTFTLSGRFPSRFFPRGLELMAEVIGDPSFPPEEIEKVKGEIEAARRQRADNPQSLVFDLLARTLHQAHPYGMSPLGTPEALHRISRSQLQAYHRRYLLGQNLVLAVVGDVDTAQVIEQVRGQFAGFTSNGLASPAVAQVSPPLVKQRVEQQQGRQQAHLSLGFLTPGLADADRYPLLVLNAILSGQGGRLFRELRDRRGLAYQVSSFFHEGIDQGTFGVYTATSPERLETARQVLEGELARVRDELIGEAELERAKRWLVGSYEIGLQSNMAQAVALADNESYGLGYELFSRYAERIQAVRAAEVQRVARQYLLLDRYTLAVVKPPG